MVNSQWLELSMSRTTFYGPKDVEDNIRTMALERHRLKKKPPGGLNQCLVEACRDTSLYSQNDLFIIGQA